MVSMRMLLGVVLGMLICMGVGSAALLLNASSNYVEVPVGGYNYTTIFIVDTLNSSYMAVSYSINNPNVTASLSGPYLDSGFTQPITGTTTTSYNTSGQISWTGTAGATYYFKLTFTSTQAGQNFQTAVSGASVTTTPTISITLTGTVVSGSVTPELITAVLVGVGLASVIIWRRWS